MSDADLSRTPETVALSHEARLETGQRTLGSLTVGQSPSCPACALFFASQEQDLPRLELDLESILQSQVWREGICQGEKLNDIELFFAETHLHPFHQM